MRRLEFEIPGLPRMQNPSGRPTHWTVLKKEKDHWHREVFFTVAGNFSGPPMQKAKLTLTRHSSVEPDFDGMVSGFKRVIDGLVVASVLVGDKMSVIGQPVYRWEKALPKKGKIHVIVEELEC